MRHTIAGFLISVCSTAAFAQVTVPHEFAAGSAARASEVNANFQALATAINALAGQSCPPNQFLSGFDDQRRIVCSPTATTLPSGATLRGRWGPTALLSPSQPVIAQATQYVVISFPLLLPATPNFHPSTHWMLQSESTQDCPGIVNGLPQAAPGHLCVYQTNTDASSGVGSKTAQWSRLGVDLILTSPTGASIPGAEGVWAVTAP